MSHVTIQKQIPERSTRLIQVTLVDENGTPILAANISTITLSLWREGATSVINNRNEQSVKDSNGGSMHATSGVFTMELGPLDNVLSGDGGSEKHHAEFVFTLTTSEVERLVVSFYVEDLPDKP